MPARAESLVVAIPCSVRIVLDRDAGANDQSSLRSVPLETYHQREAALSARRTNGNAGYTATTFLVEFETYSFPVHRGIWFIYMSLTTPVKINENIFHS